MFEALLIHPRTKTQLERFVGAPSHGVIISAPAGSGKHTLALHLAAALLGLGKVEELASYPYFSVLNPEGPTITIDDVRSTQKLLTLKTPGTGQQIRRVIVVLDAGRMRFEAQNAFLKSLEEPPADTCIILTSGGEGLLPTIHSRLQLIDVQPVALEQAASFFEVQDMDQALVESNYALAAGQVGLLASLLHEEAHPLKDWVETAKNLLKQPAAARLLEVEQLSRDKNAGRELVGALRRIARAALRNASKSGNRAAVQRWQGALKLVGHAEVALLKNANTKLVLDHLLLNI